MSIPRIPIPDGYEEIRIQRTHQGRTHRDFLGRHQRMQRVAEIKLRSDGELHPLDKAELLPPGLWDFHEFVAAAASAAGVSYQQAMREAQALLPRALQSIHSGHSRPDLTENAHVGDRGSGPQQS